MNADPLLNAALAGDLAAMLSLSREEGGRLLAEGEVDAACFFLSNALVFALECGDERQVQELTAVLKSHARL